MAIDRDGNFTNRRSLALESSQEVGAANTGSGTTDNGTGNTNSGNQSTNTNGSGDNGVQPSDLERFSDVLGRLFNQDVSIPSPGEPVVVPTQTTKSSMIPVLLIMAGIGIIGFHLYKGKKQHEGGEG